MNAGNTLSSNNNLAAYYSLNKQETVNNNNTTNTDSNESNLNKIGNGMFRSLMSLTRAESNLPQSSASEQQINDTMNSELNVNSFDQESDEYENLNQDNSESKPTFPSLTSSLNNNSGNNVGNNNNTRNINNNNNENNNGNNNTNNNGSNSANTPQRQIASSKDRLPSTVELSSALGIPIKHKPRRVWTPEEDAKLRTLVAEWGDQRGKNSHWDKISESMPGRTGKDCRKRWFHSLDPTLKRGRWTEDEDRILQEAYKELGPLWNRIAQLIPGRTDDQCSKRYNDVLDPRVQTRLRGWTKEEDDLLMEMCKTHGTQWKVIAAHLPGRTGLTCRNRWRKLAASKLQWNNQGNRKRMPKGGKANNKQPNATKSNDEEEELEEDENSNDNDNESELSSTLTKDSDTKMMDVTNNNNSKPDNANNLSVSDLSLNSRIPYGSKVPSNFSRYGNSESNIRAQQQQQQSSSMQNDYPTGSTPLPLDESFSLMQSSEAQALFQNVTGLSNSMPQSPLPFRNNNTSNSKMSNSNNTIDSTTTTTNYSFSLDNRSGQLNNSNSSTSRNNTNSDVGDLANETHAIKREDIEVLVKIAKENGVGIIIHQNNYHTHQHQHIHYYDRNEGNFERDDYNSINNNSNKNNNSNNNEENRSNAQRQYVGLNNLLNSPTNTTSANRNSSNSNQKNNNSNSSNDQRTVPYIQTHPHFKELEQIDMDPEPFRYISLYPTPATNNSNNNNNTSTSTHAGGYGGTPSSSSQYSPLSYEGIPFNPS